MKTYFNELKNIFIETFKYFYKNKFMIIPILLFAFPIFVLCFAFSTTYAYTDENSNTYYDFNQLNDRFNLNEGLSDLIDNSTASYINGYCNWVVNNNFTSRFWVYITQDRLIANHKYLLSFNCETNINDITPLIFYCGSQTGLNIINNEIQSVIFTPTDVSSSPSLFTYGVNTFTTSNYFRGYINIIDLTKMFGANNEPITIDGANTAFNLLGIDLLNYNEYTISDYIYISDYSTTQYQTLQSDYNSLLNSYTNLSNNYLDYVSKHSYTDTQYNELVTEISTLQNQITTLQNQYNAYVNTHSYTNEQYNTLNNQYQSLQNDYNSLVSTYFNLLRSYNDLQDRYDSLLAESTNAMYFALNGATANLYTDVSGTKTLLATDTVSINQSYMNFDNSCIPNINTYLNAYDSSDTTNYPNPYCYIEIELNMSVNSALLFIFDNSILDTDITLSSTISDVTTIYNRNSELNPYQLVVNSDRLSFNKITYDGIYMPDYISIDFSLQLDGYSYSLGYEKGVASQQSYINSLNSSVSTMQASINTLRASNQQLQEQVNNTFGWKNLFFAMADTPFKTISNVLGFELFGLNLFTTFIGMITVFAIVWLLKKFI